MRFPRISLFWTFARLHRPSSTRLKRLNAFRIDGITTLVVTRPVACLTVRSRCLNGVGLYTIDCKTRSNWGLSWIGSAAHDQSFIPVDASAVHHRFNNFPKHDGTISPNVARGAGSRRGGDLCCSTRLANRVGAASLAAGITNQDGGDNSSNIGVCDSGSIMLGGRHIDTTEFS